MHRRIVAFIVVISFMGTLITPISKARAEGLLGLPAPGAMVALSPAYRPAMIIGLTVHRKNPFLFDFIVDQGDDHRQGDAFKKEGERLIKYFLANLAIPEKDLWVNLSPYEKNKIIPGVLGQTEMGRDLLAEDYMLKQITASLIYPGHDLGKAFWQRVYSQAQARYGHVPIPVNTFNKVWIMADKAQIFEHGQSIFVVACHLKVMLEEDYLAAQKHQAAYQPNQPWNLKASQVVREIILPEIEHEVNTGKNFANLRQIFNSIILSSWYKHNLKDALLNQIYANKQQVKGIDLKDPSIKDKIYDRYLQAYKKGVFNFIREDQVNGKMMPRKYFSGGVLASVHPTEVTDEAMRAFLSPSLGQRIKTFRARLTANVVHALGGKLNPNFFAGLDLLRQRKFLARYYGLLFDDRGHVIEFSQPQETEMILNALRAEKGGLYIGFLNYLNHDLNSFTSQYRLLKNIHDYILNHEQPDYNPGFSISWKILGAYPPALVDPQSVRQFLQELADQVPAKPYRVAEDRYGALTLARKVGSNSQVKEFDHLVVKRIDQLQPWIDALDANTRIELQLITPGVVYMDIYGKSERFDVKELMAASDFIKDAYDQAKDDEVVPGRSIPWPLGSKTMDALAAMFMRTEFADLSRDKEELFIPADSEDILFRLLHALERKAQDEAPGPASAAMVAHRDEFYDKYKITDPKSIALFDSYFNDDKIVNVQALRVALSLSLRNLREVQRALQEARELREQNIGLPRKYIAQEQRGFGAYEKSPAQLARGGIDLDTSQVNWAVRKDGSALVMDADPAMLKLYETQGLESISINILGISTVSSIWTLMGIVKPVR